MTLELDERFRPITITPYQRFLYALKAPETKRQYPKRIEIFLNFVGISGSPIEDKLMILYDRAKSNGEWLQNALINFIIYQKERASNGEIKESTIPNYYKPVKLFCDMNDILINWKIVTRGMPRGRSAANDRAPILEEIIQILRYPDVRIKPIILVMLTSGIRVGAWDFLKWKHIIPIYTEESIVAAKIIVYAEEREQYFSFITPEAYNELKGWMDYRSSYGEKITNDSWVMRDLWRTTNMTYGAKLGYAKSPKKFKSNGIRNLISKALFQQNVRPILKEGQKRHEFKAAHGFRKYFKTKSEQVMKTSNVELIMGHSLGIASSYYKPSEKEVLDDYTKAIDLLTINYESITLKKQVQKLETEGKTNEYIIKGKLQEKDEEIKVLNEQFASLKRVVENMVTNFGNSANQQDKNSVAQCLFDSGVIEKSN
jgi:integrase